MMEQRTDDWFSARLGKVTASRISDVVAKTKSGVSASRGNYMAQLIVERMTNKPTESYSNSAMQWGTDTEPLARAAYEMATNTMVEEVGFVQHPDEEMCGASPDGLVGEDGLIEIKCPNTATHIETLINGEIDNKYILQMQWQMACTGRQWCDFVSFDPRMPESLQLKIIRVNRLQSLIIDLETQVEQFLNETQEKIDFLNNLKVQNG
jgi:putative phage-type endonuclease